MDVEARLKELGIKLPEAPGAKGNYIGAKWAGNIAFSCGQGPFETTKRGMVGEDLTIEEGYQGARETALNCLAQLKKQMGTLDNIKQVLQVVGFVNSAEGFMDQPKVLNGFTERPGWSWSSKSKFYFTLFLRSSNSISAFFINSCRRRLLQFILASMKLSLFL